MTYAQLEKARGQAQRGAALRKGLRNVLSGKLVTGFAQEKLEMARPKRLVTSGLDVHEAPPSKE